MIYNKYRNEKNEKRNSKGKKHSFSSHTCAGHDFDLIPYSPRCICIIIDINILHFLIRSIAIISNGTMRTCRSLKNTNTNMPIFYKINYSAMPDFITLSISRFSPSTATLAPYFFTRFSICITLIFFPPSKFIISHYILFYSKICSFCEIKRTQKYFLCP